MQGFNMGRYYPPDAENSPSFNKTSHPLGSRAKNINAGVLTVRFELPFAVWCLSPQCKGEVIVGQGVRFNAQKKTVGKYYSTPIYSFRMKHTACGGWWEIRTDPQNSKYVVVEGARMRDYGPEDKQLDGELAFLSPEEREKRREDAFAMFEGKKADQVADHERKERLEELQETSEVWRDDWAANQKLRKQFRGKRKFLEGEQREKEGLQDKFSLGIEIAGEMESDRARAVLVDFGSKDADADIVRRGLFDKAEMEKKHELVSTKGKLKSEIIAEKSRQTLQQALVGNTKAAIDPFLAGNEKVVPKTNLRILKKQRIEEPKVWSAAPPPAIEQSLSDEHKASPVKGALANPLVDYDSD